MVMFLWVAHRQGLGCSYAADFFLCWQIDQNTPQRWQTLKNSDAKIYFVDMLGGCAGLVNKRLLDVHKRIVSLPKLRWRSGKLMLEKRNRYCQLVQNCGRCVNS